MAINAKAVVRVIIEGEWIWVERGTFTVMPLEFVDDNDNPVGASKEPIAAYFFVSTNGDPYFGPLHSISLFKLDTQILEETGSGPPARGRPFELPEGSGETFGGEVGPRAVAGDDSTTEAPADDAGADEPKKAVPLFADDVEEEDELFSGERRRGGGLF